MCNADKYMPKKLELKDQAMKGFSDVNLKLKANPTLKLKANSTLCAPVEFFYVHFTDRIHMCSLG